MSRRNKNNRNRIGRKIWCNSYSREDEENDNGGLAHAGGNAIQRRLFKTSWWTKGGYKTRRQQKWTADQL